MLCKHKNNLNTIKKRFFSYKIYILELIFYLLLKVHKFAFKCVWFR